MFYYDIITTFFRVVLVAITAFDKCQTKCHFISTKGRLLVTGQGEFALVPPVQRSTRHEEVAI
jgi:hypothetical protein